MTMKNTLKSTVKSTWTPLNKEEANVAMFSERKNLVFKWFDRWNSEQRRTVLEGLLNRCTEPQLAELHSFTSSRAPVPKADFTVHLPRHLSLHILSFLDPRSLCRAAQTCWRWKWLAESDEIWLTKCVRVGWYPSDPEKHIELANSASKGVYKQVYIDHLRALQVEGPTKAHQLQCEKDAKRAAQERLLRKLKKKEEERRKGRNSTPAWKGPDKKPTDTVRMNYLDEGDMKDVQQRQKSAEKRKKDKTTSLKLHAANIRQIHQEIRNLSTRSVPAENFTSRDTVRSAGVSGRHADDLKDTSRTNGHSDFLGTKPWAIPSEEADVE